MNEEFDEDSLPEHLRNSKPIEPLPEQCCGSGCSLCVFDIFEQELKIWRKECLQYLNQSWEEVSTGPVLLPNYYSKFKLAFITTETKDCNVYRFIIPDNKALHLQLGQHLILRGKTDGRHVSRQYTPISHRDAKGFFDVMIKVYENGVMSRYISQLKPGDEVEWRGPFGGLNYEPNQFKKIFLIAGGTGIAPMISLLQTIIENEDDETFLRLLFACKTHANILLKKTLNHFKSFWNFTVRYYLSQEPETERKFYGDDIFYGRIDKHVLLEEIKPKENCKVFICGPVSFNKDMENYLQDILDKEDYYIFQ